MLKIMAGASRYIGLNWKSGAKLLLFSDSIVRIFRTSVSAGLKCHEFARQRGKKHSLLLRKLA